MLKKITLIGLVAVLSAGIVTLAAQGGATGARGRRQGFQQGPGRSGGMRGAELDTWLADLEQAYQNNDREKLGQVIKDMKQQRESMQEFMGRGRGGAGGGEAGRGGRGTAGEAFGRGRGGFGGGGTSAAAGTPLAKTETEKKILSILDDLDRNQRQGMMNVPVVDGRLLRLLAEAVGARHIVEIGTSNGYSGIWQCLALKTTGGKLTTFEIDARRASLARENFKRAGLDGIVTLIEGDAHETVTKIKEPIDVLFIDADKQGYTDYLNKLLPLVRPGGLILAHNISTRQSNPRYMEAITKNPDLETLLYQQGAGISITLKKRTAK